ncbi:hypothetical protein MAPG_05719, partial [Magnaporthiopsis poae ATCC 64411]
MDDANPKTAEGDSTAPRRPSTAQSAVQSDQDDAYLQAMVVQDGFRPTLTDITPSQGTSPRSSYLTAGDSESPLSTPRDCNLASASPPSRPSSIAKAPGPDSDSSVSQNDGSAASKSAEPATISSSQESSDSTLTSASALSATEAMQPPRHDSPYQGPSGPSHPYQLYPQDVRIARTMSTRTSSTTGPLPAEQPYSGPHGPAHPYGMYSQNTAVTPQHPVVGASADAAVVGFPGVATDPYRRRLGPEGEEMGGLVGPDGHTEELPPYTRYPDEQIARKVRDAEAVQSAHSTSPSQAATQTASSTSRPTMSVALPIPGAGGIGIAARNPEFDSIDDLNTPRSRNSSRSFTSTSETSHHEINTAAAAVASEKESKRWEKSGRKRLCGVPRWVVVLVITAILVVGLVLGAVLGTLLGRQPRPPPPAQGAPPPFYDAVPIPVPSGLPPMPTGSFGMPLMPLAQRDVCFQDTTHAPAWTCGLAFSPAIVAMVMTISGGDNGNPYKVSMSTNNSLSTGTGAYSYGAQAPLLPPGTFTMQTVNDTLEPSRGPAWFKMMPFNKTVFISEANFPGKSGSPSHRRLRRTAPPSFDEMKRKISAQPGDKPWACTWPDTVLEIFIYPNQNASLFKTMSSNGVGLPGSPPGGGSS